MRGKVRTNWFACSNCGITPAYAGKRVKYDDVVQTDKDHPRLCGEKLIQNSRNPSHLGSPPPMRGKVYNSSRVEQRNRITPAYAGKSERWTHERIAEYGSPPPMRGKARLSSGCRARARITPAYAGKSQIHRDVQFFGRDHPRLCGEKFIFQNVINYLAGSPPPMRGKVENGAASGAFSRITPAYAGKSLAVGRRANGGWDHPRLCGEKPIAPF